MGRAADAARLRMAWQQELSELEQAGGLELEDHTIRRALAGRE
jgi:hypothetical protein